jgi:hypothetical protein
MSPQEKRHGVMARIWTSDLTIERRTLYHLSYPARQFQGQPPSHSKENSSDLPVFDRAYRTRPKYMGKSKEP